MLLRSLNKNQLLILSNANGSNSVTALLQQLSERSSVPVSTLKLNARILKELGLLDFNGVPAKATRSGELVLRIMIR